MDAMLVVAGFVGFAVAAALWGADSRPGFSDGRFERMDRWYPGFRRDIRKVRPRI